mgnify:CR=1 FL=1
MQVKHSFPPVTDVNTRLLLLGSLPGEVSLAQTRYYAHPRNQFWTLLGDVLGTDLVRISYPERLERLLAAGVGLWDVVASATRKGSLDMHIRGHVPNELGALAKSLPRLRAIAFNGKTAAAIGRRQIGHTSGLVLIDLPSSSPANTLPLSGKREQWRALRAWLEEEGRPNP